MKAYNLMAAFGSILLIAAVVQSFADVSRPTFGSKLTDKQMANSIGATGFFQSCSSATNQPCATSPVCDSTITCTTVTITVETDDGTVLPISSSCQANSN